jgi:NAD-dependent SIR2 family protein deacetylase
LIRGSQILNSISTEVEGSEKFAFTNKVLEMHGNVKYMHCSNESEEHSR